ncbi:S8 family serine peptidase [Bacillaceae bacterium W0354]
MHKKVILILFIMFSTPYLAHAEDSTWIIEVDRDPHEVKYYIEAYYPLLEVEYVYDTILKALAVTGSNRHIEKLHKEQFIKSINAAQTYVVPNSINNSESNLKKSVNYHPIDSNYTGKGIKVGVIDTGIDYNHPDLTKNFKGGFDVVDFDKDPMETSAEEGIPTIHGTHVAGIIASDGKIRGVAPDAEIYAYRALGPGGSGSSAQVMAAIEQAVKDGMDIINMSLGSTVNSPDDPMTKAVNRAIELGTTVVVANGNSGPDGWTVGSPATSDDAISVGASIKTQHLPQLSLANNQKIDIRSIPLSKPWNFKKDYPIETPTTLEDIQPSIHDRIILIEKGSESYRKIIQTIDEKGATAVIIYSDASDDPNEWEWTEAAFPVIFVTDREAKLIKQNGYWLETTYQTITDEVAPFSSRGPVTSTWQIKPDLLAPGVDILSTIPNGYASLQGTSMAAPYITGVLALLKEAHPNESPKQLKDRLLSTADLFVKKEESEELPPSIQGNGHVNVKNAIKTKFTISNNRLHFGKIEGNENVVKDQITITNHGDEPLTVSFNYPKRQKGVTWILPFTESILPNEEKTFDIEGILQHGFLEEGLFEGYLTVNLNGEEHHLSYLMMHETANYPRIAGLEMEMAPFQNEQIKLRLYIPENIDELSINLFDHNNIHVMEILSEKEVKKGYLEKQLLLKNLPSGEFQAVISAVQDGEQYTKITEIYFP